MKRIEKISTVRDRISCSSFKPDCQELPNPCGATILSSTNTQFKGVTAYPHHQIRTTTTGW